MKCVKVDNPNRNDMQYVMLEEEAELLMQSGCIDKISEPYHDTPTHCWWQPQDMSLEATIVHVDYMRRQLKDRILAMPNNFSLELVEYIMRNMKVHGLINLSHNDRLGLEISMALLITGLPEQIKPYREES